MTLICSSIRRLTDEIPTRVLDPAGGRLGPALQERLSLDFGAPNIYHKAGRSMFQSAPTLDRISPAERNLCVTLVVKVREAGMCPSLADCYGQATSRA